jgi:hypothetical protein
MESAVRAERLADLAAAEYRVAELAGKVASTAADKKAVLENEVKAARETHAKAAVRAAGPVTQEDRFEPLFGAKWTPTRFLSSTKDDPALSFPKQSTGRLDHRRQKPTHCEGCGESPLGAPHGGATGCEPF